MITGWDVVYNIIMYIIMLNVEGAIAPSGFMYDVGPMSDMRNRGLRTLSAGPERLTRKSENFNHEVQNEDI
jgi:hypothetical protein